ncbi:metallophosphoesterase family protein [Thermithiobacillus plumbiphilus]|uniref:Metallophosphoesterase n=1 Tax=Thermithiobacillus plumbiphilus TaxID=1729899 RepID=A0ABU9D4P9_9PROT
MAQQEQVRVAAVGDLHVGPSSAGAHRDAMAHVNQDADLLLLCGDLTNFGTVEEMAMMLEELSGVTIPILSVLGNHDYESGQEKELLAMMRRRGIHVLDEGEPYQYNDWLGFAGVKGFCGGYARGSLSPFGEAAIKRFVQESLDEIFRLELALRKLPTPVRVVLYHYGPVIDTVRGEPLEIYPFLGTSRLAEPLDNYDVSACFHGHAHRGSLRGKTLSGIPVFNVALPVLKALELPRPYYVHTLCKPEEERRQQGTPERRQQPEKPPA